MSSLSFQECAVLIELHLLALKLLFRLLNGLFELIDSLLFEVQLVEVEPHLFQTCSALLLEVTKFIVLLLKLPPTNLDLTGLGATDSDIDRAVGGAGSRDSTDCSKLGPTVVFCSIGLLFVIHVSSISGRAS